MKRGKNFVVELVEDTEADDYVPTAKCTVDEEERDCDVYYNPDDRSKRWVSCEPLIEDSDSSAARIKKRSNRNIPSSELAEDCFGIAEEKARRALAPVSEKIDQVLEPYERMKAYAVEKVLSRQMILFECLAEFVGTFIIVLFGVGSVATVTLTGAQVGLWQVAVVWGFAVTIAICCTASISGAHLNPAVSLALAMFRRKEFPVWKLLPFWSSQIAGAVVAAGLNYLLFYSQYSDVCPYSHRSDPDDLACFLAASSFGEYFPNPGFSHINAGPISQHAVSPLLAMTIEAFGTGVLMFVILAVTDSRNKVVKDAAPVLIGFTVAILISVYAPYTQAGWNPARDFGPRLVACMAGWGKVAIPGPRNGFWVYIVGPLIGAPIAALLYDTSVGVSLLVQEIRSRRDVPTKKEDVECDVELEEHC